MSLRRVPPACAAFALSTRCELETPPPTTWRTFPGGRLEATNQLAIDLVRRAYGMETVPHDRIVGGPGWLRSERYDLTALTGLDGLRRVPATDETDQIRTMLRSLLESRFKLRVRIEQKQEKVLQLRRLDPERLGPQIRPTRGECPPPPPGSVAMRFSECVFSFGGQVYAFNITIADLLTMLGAPTRFPLHDGTRLTGRYDFRFTRFAVLGNPDRLSEELGLELAETRASIDTLKIERAERPVDD